MTTITLPFAALTRAAVEFFRAGMLLTRANSVAAITSSAVTPGPFRLSFRIKAISASARGAIRPLAPMSCRPPPSGPTARLWSSSLS